MYGRYMLLVAWLPCSTSAVECTTSCPVTSRSAAPPRASTAVALCPKTASSPAKPTPRPAGLLATMTTLALEIRKVLLSPYAVSLKVRPASEHPRSATNRHRASKRRSKPPGFANTEHGQTPIHARQKHLLRPCSMLSSSVPMRSRCSSRLVRDTAVNSGRRRITCSRSSWSGSR